MDFDNAKENIQPLACGRDVKFLEAALSVDLNSHHEELLKQRQEFEEAIHKYEGDDPLQPWYDYIAWIEQSYPSGGKESGLEQILLKCLEVFEGNEKYTQDRRMIKLFIKYIDNQPNSTEYYQELYNLGIGTMVADLYICWAYHYDVCGNFQKAESIFLKGLDAKAQPFDILDQAHKHFGFTMSQRILHKDEENYEQGLLESMRERRFALTSLRSHRKKVGSIRTGPAVKSHAPGKIQIDKSAKESARKAGCSKNNVQVNVMGDENNHHKNETIQTEEANHSVSKSQSLLIRSIIDSARKQENMIEPGPWSKARDHSQKKIDFGSIDVATSSKNHTLPFEILEDEASNSLPQPPSPIIVPPELDNFSKGIQLPENHVTRNRPQEEWKTQVCLETETKGGCLPYYEKFYLYPKSDHEYSIEELSAYNWFKMRGIENDFTERLDSVWANDFSTGIRLFPTFKRKNDPQKEWITKSFISDESIANNCSFAIKIKEIYPKNTEEEFQIEELLAKKLKCGERKLKYCTDETIMFQEDMEETCVGGGYGRRSIYPGRKSFLPSRKSIAASSRKSMVPSLAVTTDEAAPKEIPKEMKVKENVMESVTEKEEKSEKFKVYEDSMFVSKVSEMSMEHQNKKNDSEKIQNIMPSNPDTNDKITPYNCLPQAEFTSVDQQKKTEAFEVYEDNQDDFQFKVPKPVVNSNQVQNTNKDLESEATGFLYDANETISTQNFNLMLKPGLISTPKAVKSQCSATNTPNSNTQNNFQKQIIFEKGNCQIEKNPEEQNSNSPIEQPFAFQGRQLSTIMETSEPTTGTATKSSDCDQISSPESEIETSNAISKLPSMTGGICSAKKVYPLQTISEGLIEHSTVTSSSINYKPPMKEISGLENKEETVPSLMMSLKIFEDKTDTIPKAMFIPAGKTTTKTITTPQSFKKTNFFEKMFKTPEKKALQARQEKLDTLGFDESLPKLIDLSIPKLKSGIEEIKEVNDDNSVVLDLSMKRNTAPATNLNNSLIIPGFEDFISQPKDIKKAAKMSADIEMEGAVGGVPQRNPLEDSLPKFDFPSMKSKSKNYLEKSNFLDISEYFKKPQEIQKSTKLIDDHGHTLNQSNESRTAAEKKRLSQSMYCPPIPQNFEFQPASTSLRESIAKPKISMFDRSKIVEAKDYDNSDEFFEDNIRTESFMPNTIGIKNSTFLPRSSRQVEQNLNISNIKQQNDDKKQQEMNLQTMEISQKIVVEKDEKIVINQNTNQILGMSFKQDKSVCIVDVDQPLSHPYDGTGFVSNLSQSSNRKSFLNKFSEISRKSKCVAASEPALQSNVINKNDSLNIGESKDYRISTISKNTSALRTDSLSKSQHVILDKERNNITDTDHDNNINNCNRRSIYENLQAKTPIFSRHAWENIDKDTVKVLQSDSQNIFVEEIVDLNHTRQVIEKQIAEKYINPFKTELHQAFLDNIEFFDYLKSLKTCMLLNKIPCLKKNDVVNVNNRCFKIQKIIGEGTYGTVYSAKEQQSEKMYALKQEKPANLWEYYICLELRSRIKNPDFFSAFMNVKYAIIGNNAGILISDLSKYGSLINVCNKVNIISNKHLDEYIVMILSSQMLAAIDHLHSCNIIHADIKADNFLLMSGITYGDKRPVIQLIDFGCSIDMEQFPDGQKFNYIFSSNDFKCIEMRENRPWTYQIDLYGLASTIHVLLFGRYMDVEKRSGKWMHKTVVPRYYKKLLWQMIFNTLLNIPNCNSMPNLQELKTTLEEEIEDNEKCVRDKISQFNMFMNS